MADMLAFRRVSGEHVEVMAQVEDAEFPAAEFLMARWVRLDDGTGHGGTRLRQHRVATGARRADGYERLDNEILAGRRLHEVADWSGYPAEVACLYGDEASSGDPYSLLEPYQGTPLREVGGYLLDEELAALEASLLTGLCWLAAAGIAHRAISPDTVLWDSSRGQAQITDFSLSTVFGVPRTPVPGPQSWVAREQRPGTCEGTVSDRDDIWAAGRLIFFARNQGEELMDRGQLAERGLAGLLDGVFGPPHGRPAADELLQGRLGRPNPVPRVADGLARARAGRDMFLAARARRHPGAPLPPGFDDDLTRPGGVTVADPARAASPGQAASPGASQAAAPPSAQAQSPADAPPPPAVPPPGAPGPGGREAREPGRAFRWKRGAP
jgi:hypothetical protein